MTPEFDIDLLPLDNSYFAQLACRNHLALFTMNRALIFARKAIMGRKFGVKS